MAVGRKSSTQWFSRTRWFRGALFVAATLAVLQPQSASAWTSRWHAGFWGYGFGGCGFTSYRSFTCWTPGFYSGCIYPVIPYGCGWQACSPVVYLPTYLPAYGCAPYPFAPIVNPFPSAFAPVYGPAGVFPFLGISVSTAPPAAAGGFQRIAAVQPPMQRLQQLQQPRRIAVHASNNAARLRAGKLVAVGDRHLRDAVENPRKLSAALDAYRRAEAIAPDLPDTLVRQAIVLAALDRPDDAAAAVARAVAIDGRLGTDRQAALAAAERLPPDPVFGDRPMGEPSALASRSASLLERIFREDAGDDGRADANWIAERWSRQEWFQESLDGVNAVAKK